MGHQESMGYIPGRFSRLENFQGNFMSNQTLFNDLKLRAGYGVTGSQPSDLFRGVAIIGYQVNNVSHIT